MNIEPLIKYFVCGNHLFDHSCCAHHSEKSQAMNLIDVTRKFKTEDDGLDYIGLCRSPDLLLNRKKRGVATRPRESSMLFLNALHSIS